MHLRHLTPQLSHSRTLYTQQPLQHGCSDSLLQSGLRVFDHGRLTTWLPSKEFSDGNHQIINVAAQQQEIGDPGSNSVKTKIFDLVSGAGYEHHKSLQPRTKSYDVS
jgi:hypothetical protein